MPENESEFPNILAPVTDTFTERVCVCLFIDQYSGNPISNKRWAGSGLGGGVIVCDDSRASF